MEHNKKLIEKIAIEVQTEYQMGGLAEGLYLDFATDVATRYANSILPQEYVNCQILSIGYLMEIHPELNYNKAELLLKFCKEHTIRNKECYGNGSIMFPMWKKSLIE